MYPVIKAMSRSLVLAVSLLPANTYATGVSFGGTEVIWIAIAVIAISIFISSLFVTHRLAKKHNTPWYWVIWVGVFLWAVHTIFYTHW